MKLIKQRTDIDCVICCVAMAASVSYEEACEAFDDKPPYNEPHELVALTRLGIFGDTSRYGTLLGGCISIITVPSLNIKAVNHRIVVDTTVPGYTVYDPQNGVPGKEAYITYSDIKGFSEVIRVFDTRKPIKFYPR